MARSPNTILPDLRSLLAAHGLDGAREEPFAHLGFSGAGLTRLIRSDGERFVLKRMSIERDWIMRATDDAGCREARLAQAHVRLPDGVKNAALAAALDADECALLMRDISPWLLPGAVNEDQLDLILRRMAELHSAPVPVEMDAAWCDAGRRLTLLTPQTAGIAASYGAPVARDLIEGWRIFEEFAPTRVATLIRELAAEPSPLLRALGGLPAAFLHGDLKFDNIGLDEGGRMWLIDWAMTLVAPPAVELGWFLAINSRRMSAPLDDVLARYAGNAGIAPEHRARHDALAVMCGLLLRGWRKALDAEGGESEELRWWCERVEAATPLL